MKAEIAIIGGTGIYNTEIISNNQTLDLETPYGKTSDSLTIGEFNGKNIVFTGTLISISRDEAKYMAKEVGAKRAILLPVSVPSHCLLMKEAADEFSKLLN